MGTEIRPQPGDVVDVEIRGGEVIPGIGENATWIKTSNGVLVVVDGQPDVTVTRSAPRPRAGDTWRWPPTDCVFQIYRDHGAGLRVLNIDGTENLPIDDCTIAWADAELLFRLPTPTAKEHPCP